MRSAVRLALVVVSATALQSGVASQLRIDGVAADLLLAVAIAGGLASDDQRGAITGFFCGLALDLLMPSRPLGLSALAYCLTGFVVGRWHQETVRDSRMAPVVVAAVATVGGAGLYVLLARIVSGLDLFSSRLWSTLAIMAVVNALLALPLRRVLRWVWDTDTRVRPLVR